jgi:hypothetical protein
VARRGLVRSNGSTASRCEISRGRRILTIRFQPAMGGSKLGCVSIQNICLTRSKTGSTAEAWARAKQCASKSTSFSVRSPSYSLVFLRKSQARTAARRAAFVRWNRRYLQKRGAEPNLANDWGVAAVIAKQVRLLTFVLTQGGENGKQSRVFSEKRFRTLTRAQLSYRD